MDALIGIIAILSVFGIPGYLIKRTLEMRHERFLASANNKKDDEIDGLREERKLLTGRIENLESIVCSVDFELNEKLNRLVLETQAPMRELSAPSEQAAASSGTENPIKQVKSVVGTSATLADPAGLAAQARVRKPSLDATQEIEAGSLLNGRYLIGRLLGRGGMGAVYLADDQALGEPVALKVVSAAFAIDPDSAAERFRREAQAARRISHKNVIRIHDLGEAGNLLYISMEYFPGKTLGELIASRGRLERDDYLDMLRQICDGLEAAHAAGVVHRDLKPGNVIVGERRSVKLIDFGLATSELRSGMTMTGQILGTPNYMSPEQVRGRPVDARSDIYSLGALSYHLVTGQLPFEGASPIAVGFAHLMEKAPLVATVRDNVPAALAQMIDQALEKDPAHRPQSVSAFRKAL